MTAAGRLDDIVYQDSFSISTRGRGTLDITAEVRKRVQAAGITTGLCHVFLHHTSASLILCENADPDVRADLERFLARLVTDGDPIFAHTDEGPDDMSAHVRTVLAGHDLTLPVSHGSCALGTWQGVYLWEHRSAGHRRSITVTVSGA